MDTNKMREQFEAGWRARYPEHGDIALKRSGLNSEDYCNTRVKDAWWAWQASREAVAVVLPDEEPGYMYYAPDVLAAIEAQGLKVAP